MATTAGQRFSTEVIEFSKWEEGEEGGEGEVIFDSPWQ
jgi:hypothetical protein